MLTWVVYDISENKTRTKVAKQCLEFGLYRVQKSVFLGEVPPNRIDEIEQFSRQLLDLETDSVYIFPVCQEDFEKCRLIGKGFDKDEVAGKVLTKVL